MAEEQIRFTLNQDCVLVKGATRAAIYDFEGKKVYSLNKTGKQILEHAFEHPISSLNKETAEFLEQIIRLGLGRFDTTTHDNKSKPHFERPNQPLTYLWLELTPNCNLHCLHCYASCSNSRVEASSSLTTEEWKRILKEGEEIGCRSVQFIGGEPLLLRELGNLIVFARQKRYRSIEVFTNATLLTNKHIQLFAENEVQVRVSLYGATDNIHDAITGVGGSFQKTSDALKLLSEHQIPTSVAVIVVQQNQNQLKNIAEYIRKLGHEYKGYDVVRPSGRGDNQSIIPTDASLIAGRTMRKPDFSTDRQTFISNRYWNNCWSGKLAVASDGKMMPCIFAREIICGNVKTHSLEEILQKKLLLDIWGITKDAIETCKDCEFRYACTDCRPLALAQNNNLYAKYPRCTYNPFTGEWNDLQ